MTPAPALNMPMLVVLAGAGLTLILIVALLWKDGPSGALKKRLDRVSAQGRALNPTRKGPQTGSIRRQTTDSSIPFLDRFIKSALPNPDKLRARLARTGKTISLGEYLLINAVAIVVFAFIFRFLAHWSPPASIFMGIAAGLFVPHAVTGKMGSRRVTKFLGSFPEAIDTICRGLRSGLPIAESIATVGAELPDPIGIEFRRISDSVRMGRPLEESMWEIARRLDVPEFRFFIIALSIQKETGGNLAETLGNLADLLRRRRQMRLKIRAMSSEARASAMIIGSLPFLMFGLLMLVNSDYVMVLLNTPKGQIMMGGGLTWLSLGIFVMKQMTNFEI